MAFYLLLVIPHLLALGGLFAWAARVEPEGARDEGAGGSDGNGGLDAPLSPQPAGPSGGLPLDGADPPPRRLRVHERLADLYPPPARREHEPAPTRTPVEL